MLKPARGHFCVIEPVRVVWPCRVCTYLPSRPRVFRSVRTLRRHICRSRRSASMHAPGPGWPAGFSEPEFESESNHGYPCVWCPAIRFPLEPLLRFPIDAPCFPQALNQCELSEKSETIIGFLRLFRFFRHAAYRRPNLTWPSGPVLRCATDFRKTVLLQYG